MYTREADAAARYTNVVGWRSGGAGWATGSPSGFAMPELRLPKLLAALAAVLFLSACKAEVLAPTGDVAAQQRDLLVISTLLMLIIIIPVMVLTCWFAWHYRAAN
eukprot:gene15507-20551_t